MNKWITRRTHTQHLQSMNRCLKVINRAIHWPLPSWPALTGRCWYWRKRPKRIQSLVCFVPIGSSTSSPIGQGSSCSPVFLFCAGFSLCANMHRHPFAHNSCLNVYMLWNSSWPFMLLVLSFSSCVLLCHHVTLPSGATTGNCVTVLLDEALILVGWLIK